jgi:hypothetical protein
VSLGRTTWAKTKVFVCISFFHSFTFLEKAQVFGVSEVDTEHLVRLVAEGFIGAVGPDPTSQPCVQLTCVAGLPVAASQCTQVRINDGLQNTYKNWPQPSTYSPIFTHYILLSSCLPHLFLSQEHHHLEPPPPPFRQCTFLIEVKFLVNG